MGRSQNSRAEYARTGKIIINNELRRHEAVASCSWIAFPGWTCPAGARSGPDACTAAEILRGRNGKTLPRNFGMPEIGDRLSPIRYIGGGMLRCFLFYRPCHCVGRTGFRSLYGRNRRGGEGLSPVSLLERGAVPGGFGRGLRRFAVSGNRVCKAGCGGSLS